MIKVESKISSSDGPASGPADLGSGRFQRAAGAILPGGTGCGVARANSGGRNAVQHGLEARAPSRPMRGSSVRHSRCSAPTSLRADHSATTGWPAHATRLRTYTAADSIPGGRGWASRPPIRASRANVLSHRRLHDVQKHHLAGCRMRRAGRPPSPGKLPPPSGAARSARRRRIRSGLLSLFRSTDLKSFTLVPKRSLGTRTKTRRHSERNSRRAKAGGCSEEPLKVTGGGGLVGCVRQPSPRLRPGAVSRTRLFTPRRPALAHAALRSE